MPGGVRKKSELTKKKESKNIGRMVDKSFHSVALTPQDFKFNSPYKTG